MEWIKDPEEKERPAPNPFVERWVRVINVIAQRYPVQAKLAEALGIDYKQFRDLYDFKKAFFNIDFLQAVIVLEKRVNPYYILFGVGPAFFEKFPLSEIEQAIGKKSDENFQQTQASESEYVTPVTMVKVLRRQLQQKEEEIVKLKQTIKSMAEYISVIDNK